MSKKPNKLPTHIDLLLVLPPPDAEAPSIECPDDIIHGSQYILSLSVDDDTDSSPDLVCDPAVGTVINQSGVTQVSCTVTDHAGRSATCDFTVTIGRNKIKFSWSEL